MADTIQLLLIDDDEFLASSMALVLQSHGYVVETATTAQEGLVALENKGPFDLILLDYFLPDMSAEAVMQEVAQKGKAPVVLMTGDQDPYGKAKHLQCYASLPKPFSMRELFAVIDGLQKQAESPTPIA